MFLQFIKFGLVGVSNTLVSYMVYTACYYIFHTSVHTANIMGFIISVLNAYIWQNYFVFKENKDSSEKRIWWKVLLKTYASYAFSGLFLSELLLLLWLNIIRISRFLESLAAWVTDWGFPITAEDAAVSVAPILNILITLPINFMVNRFWVYRKKNQ